MVLMFRDICLGIIELVYFEIQRSLIEDYREVFRRIVMKDFRDWSVNNKEIFYRYIKIWVYLFKVCFFFEIYFLN